MKNNCDGAGDVLVGRATGIGINVLRNHNYQLSTMKTVMFTGKHQVYHPGAVERRLHAGCCPSHPTEATNGQRVKQNAL